MTTLANMGKKQDEGENQNNTLLTTNGDVATEGSDSVAKAFNTLAKAAQPQDTLNVGQVGQITLTHRA